MTYRKLAFFAAILSVYLLPASAQYGRGLLPEPDLSEKVKAKALLMRSDYGSLPASHSLKRYAPVPQNQGNVGTCVAWSVAYNARTISYSIQNKLSPQEVNKHTFSPGYLYRLIEPSNSSCNGALIGKALQWVSAKGVPLYADFPQNCVTSVPSYLDKHAADYKIDDYAMLFESRTDADKYIKVERTKKALSENKPVLFGMHCPGSFSQARDRWIPTASDYMDANQIIVNQNFSRWSGHAMCVVGYDDNKYGGAFEIINSWGTGWGNGGFTWITYDDFRKFAAHAFEMVEYKKSTPEVVEEEPDLSGTIRFIDHATNQELAFKKKQVNSRGIEIGSDEEDNQNVSYEKYELTGEFKEGFKFRVKLSNNEPAFVYAFGSDLKNNINKLFPATDMISAYLNYSSNNIMLPGDKKYYRLDENSGGNSVWESLQGGTDFFCMLYSKKELDINAILRKLKADTSEETLSQKLKAIIGSDMVDYSNITFERNNIGFKALSKGKSVVALIVTLKRSRYQ